MVLFLSPDLDFFFALRLKFHHHFPGDPDSLTLGAMDDVKAI
jgi:hypothetical protein